MEEASLMGFSGGFEQGKPVTALPELGRFHTSNCEKGQSIINNTSLLDHGRKTRIGYET
jgi:hypothetical protein